MEALSAQTCALGAVAHHLTLKPGASIAPETLASHSVLALKSGALAFRVLLPDGRRSLPKLLLAGEIADCRQPDGKAPADVIAVGISEICMIPADAFDRLLESNPDANRFVLDEWRHQAAIAEHHAVDIGRKSPSERVASFIFELCERRNDGESSVPLPLSRSDLADYLALNADTLSRAFRQLERDGLISLPRPSAVVIQDEDTLRRVADGAA